jgi:phosphatidylinositol-3-phosphatase
MRIGSWTWSAGGAAVAGVLGALLLGVVGCAPTSAAGVDSRASAVPTPKHVVIVVEENHSNGKAIAGMPYLAALGRSGAVFMNSHAVAHPSEPNYLALWSGSTQHLMSDACPLSFGSKPNLGAQLISKGHSVAAYAQSLPAPGSSACTSGAYARKHVPLADFAATADARHVLPFTAFPSDFGSLPAVSLVVPDLDHDAHDGSLATADRWLHDRLGRYATWARTHDSLLIVTFDEDDHDTSDNRILTVVTGQHVRPGRYAERVDHIRLLQTVEAAFRLPPLGAARRPIVDIWR